MQRPLFAGENLMCAGKSAPHLVTDPVEQGGQIPPLLAILRTFLGI